MGCSMVVKLSLLTISVEATLTNPINNQVTGLVSYLASGVKNFTPFDWLLERL